MNFSIENYYKASNLILMHEQMDTFKIKILKIHLKQFNLYLFPKIILKVFKIDVSFIIIFEITLF